MDRVEPTRLILARRFKQMTKRQLADDLKVSPPTVGHWEDGRREATAYLPQIAEALGQPIAFFYGSEVPITDPSWVTFRKRQSATRGPKDRAASAIDMAAGVLNPAVEEVFGGLRPVDVPDCSGMSPEAAAEATRRHWGLGDGPIRNVVGQLEARGVRVYWVTEANPALSAFCRWIDGQPYVILNTAKRDGCRSRYDACHELAHLTMHRDLNFDRDDARVYEREADAFASAFLMPRDTFLQGAPRRFDAQALLARKPLWRVSVQAMVRRLKDLGVLADWQYENAYKRMSAWGWRSQAEPGAGPMEVSSVHWQMCDRLESDDIDPKAFCRRLGVSWNTCAEMMPVLSVRQLNLSLNGVFDDGAPIVLDGPAPVTLPYDD